MKTHSSVYIFITSLLVFSCSNKRAPIAVRADYERFVTTSVTTVNHEGAEIKFWQDRLAKNAGDETSITKLAGLHSEKFKITGDIRDILLSDSLYKRVLSQYPEGSVDIYQCLAANAITQHRFRDAKTYAEKALALKDKAAASLLILADVSLELGDVASAKRILEDFKNKNSFAYLIRKAKVADHEGELDSAILLMEKAYARVKGNKATAHWTLSNLGDMYGHAGRIEEAYRAYLHVLKEDSRDSYALKGIAWIAFSNDHNTEDSKFIINALAERKRMPEAYLMLAEIADFERDKAGQMMNLRRFVEMASVPGYKTMYHKYLANLEADIFKHPEISLQIAEREIANRPTPQSYDLLAWAYYSQKDVEKAFGIATSKIQDQTFEPDALYHLGMIHFAKGNTSTARGYLEQALSSEFELGPVVSEKIRQTLNSL